MPACLPGEWERGQRRRDGAGSGSAAAGEGDQGRAGVVRVAISECQWNICAMPITALNENIGFMLCNVPMSIVCQCGFHIKFAQIITLALKPPAPLPHSKEGPHYLYHYYITHTLAPLHVPPSSSSLFVAGSCTPPPSPPTCPSTSRRSSTQQ